MNRPAPAAAQRRARLVAAGLVAVVALIGLALLLRRPSSVEQQNKQAHGWTGHVPHVFTVDELRRCRGERAGQPLLLAIEGVVFDVSVSKKIYGPGGPYSFFAGRDATRSFADGCFTDACFRPDQFTDEADEDERDAIARWYESFRTAVESKWRDYPFVGYVDSIFQHYHPKVPLTSIEPPLSAHI